MILPLHLNMLIRPAAASVSPGGILLTESTSGFRRGTIVEMGDGEFQNGTFIDATEWQTIASPGDDVYFTGGAPITDPGTGETFVLVHYNNIVAIIRPDDENDEDESGAEESAEAPSFGGYTDWISWSGGECPVDGNVEVMVVLRDEVDSGGGDFASSSYGNNWFWSHRGGDYDIVFYRLV